MCPLSLSFHARHSLGTQDDSDGQSGWRDLFQWALQQVARKSHVLQSLAEKRYHLSLFRLWKERQQLFLQEVLWFGEAQSMISTSTSTPARIIASPPAQATAPVPVIVETTKPSSQRDSVRSTVMPKLLPSQNYIWTKSMFWHQLEWLMATRTRKRFTDVYTITILLLYLFILMKAKAVCPFSRHSSL